MAARGEQPGPKPAPSEAPTAPRMPAAAARAQRQAAYPAVVVRLIDELARLPGIGRRSAERLAFHLLKVPPEDALSLSSAIADARQKVRPCRVCSNLADIGPDAEHTLCAVCADARRDRATIMVVEQPRDLIALEQTGMFRGVYHVLMGRVSPLEGVGPADLTTAELLARIDDPGANLGTAVKEVVLALNPTLEGDGTALFLAAELARRGVKLTRLARGLPAGSQLEYANKAVLADAIEGRRPI
ncbi:MAG: recombination mediator RecR [Phycisphaeraceae bacterium]|nr:recombination mediator RecR [Phycisphaeraceae bacterium]